MRLIHIMVDLTKLELYFHCGSGECSEFCSKFTIKIANEAEAKQSKDFFGQITQK